MDNDSNREILILPYMKKIAVFLLMVLLCYELSRIIVEGKELNLVIVLLLAPVLVLMCRRPEFIFLGIFVYLCTVFQRKVFSVSIGPRGIFPSEIMFGLACLLAVKAWRKDLSDEIRKNPVVKWLLIFLVTVLISTVSVVILMGGQMFGSQYAEIHFIRRTVLYILTILAVLLIRTKKQFVTLLSGLMVIATVMSILFTLSFLTGKEGFVVRTFPVFLETVRTVVFSSEYSPEIEFTRYGLTALVLIYAAFSLCISLYIHTRNRKWIAFIVIFFLPILLKFNRMTWVSFLMVLPIFHFTVNRPGDPLAIVKRLKPLNWGKVFTLAVILGSSVLIMAYLMNIPFLEILKLRITGLFSGISTDPSFVSRIGQFEKLLNGIRSKPLMLLLGGGSRYLTGDSVYFAILGRMGLSGIALFFVFSFQYIRRGFRLYSAQMDVVGKALILGAVVSYIQLMINGLSASFFVDYRSVATIALLLVLPDLVMRFRGERDGDGENLNDGV